jgi:antitoxin HicB
MKTTQKNHLHRGSDFGDFLEEEGIRLDVEILALKRVVALELQQILEKEHITKTQLALRMKTSRASLDRMLDPANPSLTVATLGKAAAALGRKVELRFVPA